jgi:hypothetical protein
MVRRVVASVAVGCNRFSYPGVNRLHGVQIAMIDVGTGPDSWGVWFADAPGQIHWSEYLDEVVVAGNGPTDGAAVVADIQRAGLQALASFAEVDLSDPDAHDRVAAVVAGCGDRFVVGAAYRDLPTGVALGPAELEAEGLNRLVTTCDQFGALARDRYGLVMTLHPHVATHIERTEQIECLLAATDPAGVSLVLDAGLESIDPRARTAVDREEMRLFDGAACVEQDMPLRRPVHAIDIARRTRDHLASIGIG